MYSYDSNESKSWIIRFMIDQAYQRKGLGTEALRKLIALLADKYPQSDIRLCVEPDNAVAIKMYKSFGFQPTGEKWDNELIFELKKN